MVGGTKGSGGGCNSYEEENEQRYEGAKLGWYTERVRRNKGVSGWQEMARREWGRSEERRVNNRDIFFSLC